MILNSLKNSFKQVIYNPTVVLFPVIFLIIINYLSAAAMSVKTRIIAFIIVFCAYLLFSGFLAGWFNVIKKSIDIKAIREKNFLAIFLEGFGKNIIPYAIRFFIFCAILAVVLFLASQLALKLFGSLDFILKDPYFITNDNANIAEYFKNLSEEKLYIVYCWQLCLLFASGLFNFIFLFFFPALSKESDKNIFLKPFIALKDSSIFLFKHFFSALFIYIMIHLIHITLAIVSSFAAKNAFLSLLVFFIYIYFIVFSVVLIFNYYEGKNNSSDRTDSIG